MSVLRDFIRRWAGPDGSREEPESFARARASQFLMKTLGWTLAILFGLALLLAGCMMGPDYKRPDTPAGEAWRVAPATSESLANLPWWELLKDPELHQLIRTAVGAFELEVEKKVEAEAKKLNDKTVVVTGMMVTTQGARRGPRTLIKV